MPLHRSQHRFLIVSSTALGDTLWATAAIESIRKYFPHCYLAVLTSEVGREVLEHNPYIDRLFLLEEPVLWHGFSLWKKLYRERFDTILFFHASQRLTLPLCSLLGASRIVGTKGINKGLDALLTHALPPRHEHEIVRRLKIAESLGVFPATEQLSFFGASSLPPRTGGPWIALHPGSKDDFKRWPKEKFIALGKLLKQKMSCEILITGHESTLQEEIASQIPGAHIDPPRSLSDFGALLKQMTLLVSNDTGPVHLACALNVPLVAIYASTDPALCGPHLAPRAKIISRRASCEPCLKRKCRQPFCFLQIGVEEVYQAIEEILCCTT